MVRAGCDPLSLESERGASRRPFGDRVGLAQERRSPTRAGAAGNWTTLRTLRQVTGQGEGVSAHKEQYAALRLLVGPQGGIERRGRGPLQGTETLETGKRLEDGRNTSCGSGDKSPGIDR